MHENLIAIIYFLLIIPCIVESQLIPHASRQIRIVAPSWQVDSLYTLNVAVQRLRADFAKAEYTSCIEYNGKLNEWRYYYPDTPLNRSNDLKNAVFDDTSKTILWPLTGGRNAAEVFEFFPIDKNNDVRRPLFMFGFSDITALHYYFSKYYPNIKTIHGDNAIGVPYVSHATNYLMIKDIMNGKITKIVDLKALNTRAGNLLKLDNTTILGGNVALTQRSLKTIWEPNFANKIVILEEVGETGDQLDRFLKQIKANGLFQNARAVVFGQVFDTFRTKRQTKDLEAEVLEELEELVYYYNHMKYQDLQIDYSGVAPQGVPIYSYDELQSKIGVSEFPVEAKIKFAINFTPFDDTTRFEAALLQFYQSKFIINTTKIIIVWKPLSLTKTKVEVGSRSLDSVLIDFSANIDMPVFKSEAFGHRSYNLPIPFGTLASIYSEKTTSCQGSCNGFIMEINSPF